jgi:hypothetical protein
LAASSKWSENRIWIRLKSDYELYIVACMAEC